MPSPLANLVPPGVLTGANLRNLYSHARENGYSIPSFSCTSSSTCNAVLEAARRSRSPVVIRASYASGVTFGGRSVASRDEPSSAASVAGAVALALHVRTMAPHYGVPVVLQSETRCLHRLVTWYESLLDANEAYYAQHGEPLYSSHLLDLTTDTNNEQENIDIAVKYLERLGRSKIWLELRVRGVAGETDSADELCKNPGMVSRQLWTAHDALSRAGDGRQLFSLAVTRAAYGCLRQCGECEADQERHLFLVLDDGASSAGSAMGSATDPAVPQVSVPCSWAVVQVCVRCVPPPAKEEEDNLAQRCAAIMEKLDSKGQLGFRGEQTKAVAYPEQRRF